MTVMFLKSLFTEQLVYANNNNRIIESLAHFDRNLLADSPQRAGNAGNESMSWRQYGVINQFHTWDIAFCFNSVRPSDAI